jgi:hypothetical protein
MPQYLGIYPRDPPPSRATAEEFRLRIELLMHLQAGHEAQGFIVSVGHLLEAFVRKIESGIGARIQLPRGTDPGILWFGVLVFHLCPISGWFPRRIRQMKVENKALRVP